MIVASVSADMVMLRSGKKSRFLPVILTLVTLHRHLTDEQKFARDLALQFGIVSRIDLRERRADHGDGSPAFLNRRFVRDGVDACREPRHYGEVVLHQFFHELARARAMPSCVGLRVPTTATERDSTRSHQPW